ncbi:conserved hypothetical protein [Ricinus communis]|uniref:Uncharacterized protein n=1 Tax=Ricinus communis TaxID=3988 RepID=B9RPG1_RICCO|nr:conserved hypothetical protein [Ricinus communis]
MSYTLLSDINSGSRNLLQGRVRKKGESTLLQKPYLELGLFPKLTDINEVVGKYLAFRILEADDSGCLRRRQTCLESILITPNYQGLAKQSPSESKKHEFSGYQQLKEGLNTDNDEAQPKFPTYYK